MISKADFGEVLQMAASQVVLYFDKAEDALLFTLAASSVISGEGAASTKQTLVKIAQEISKASRIKTQGVLGPGKRIEEQLA